MQSPTTPSLTKFTSEQLDGLTEKMNDPVFKTLRIEGQRLQEIGVHFESNSLLESTHELRDFLINGIDDHVKFMHDGEKLKVSVDTVLKQVK